MSRATRDHVTRLPAYAGNNFYIRPTYVVSIPEYVKLDGSGGKIHRNSRENLKRNTHDGVLSPKAAQKIRNAVNWLVQASKPKRVFDAKSRKNFYFRVNFITLTIPACDELPSDHFVKTEVFHPWLVYARKYFGLRNYVWRAEVQKNGMLHFHLVTDSFLHHRRIRDSWNKRLDKSGLLSDFKSRHGHNVPNSTDVHSVKNVRDLGAYISKYVSKSQKDARKISGRLWGCNYELSHEVKTVAICDPDETSRQIRALADGQSKFQVLLTKPDAFGKQMSVGEMYSVRESHWKKYKDTPIGRSYFNRIFQIRSHYQSMPIDYYTINSELCQSTTQSTPAIGSQKYVPRFLKELGTSVKNAAHAITQSVTEISGELSKSLMNMSKDGQSAMEFDCLRLS